MSRAAPALLALLLPLLPAARGDCAPPPRFSFAELVTSLDSYRIGTEVTYRCRPGFIRVGGKSPVITCQDNSTWSQHSEFCMAKQCPAPDIPNGRPIVTDLRLGARVNFTCSAGYRLIGSHSLRCVLDVGSNVRWDGEFPSCEKIPCLPPPEVANGAHSGEGEGYVFGSSVTYTCKSGFSLVGEASIHCTTEDNLHGVWSPAPQCKEVKCPVPVVPHGKKKSGSVAVYSYGDTIIFECNPGYLLRGGGDGVIRCAEDNTWKPSVPICDPGPGANSTEEEAQPKSGNAYKMAFGVLAPVVVGCVICIGGVLLYQNNKKGTYEAPPSATTDPRQEDSNSVTRKTNDTLK